MKYVLFVRFSEPAEALLPTVPQQMREHIARMRLFHERGELSMSGAFCDPGEPLQTMGVFTTREAAEAFAAGDPFISSGMAESWTIREWNELLPQPASERLSCLPVKYVLMFQTRYRSMDAAIRSAPDEIRHHIARTNDFGARGLLMAGAFCDSTEWLSTMCILESREAAEEFAAGDPFVLNGMVSQRVIHAWNDVVATVAANTA